jgi:hypothetical protein
LHTTGPLDELCAEETAGAASNTAASTALKVRPLSFVFMRFTAVLPFEPPLMFPAGRIPQSPRRRYVGPDVVRLRSKLNEDPTR